MLISDWALMMFMMTDICCCRIYGDMGILDFTVWHGSIFTVIALYHHGKCGVVEHVQKTSHRGELR